MQPDANKGNEDDEEIEEHKKSDSEAEQELEGKVADDTKDSDSITSDELPLKATAKVKLCCKELYLNDLEENLVLLKFFSVDI